MKKQPTTTQAYVIDDGAVTDEAGVRYEQEQRELLEKAAEARAFLAKSRVEERSTPEPPMPAADSSAREQRRAALDEELVRLQDQIRVAGVNKAEAEKAEKVSAEQRERDNKLLAAEQGRLQQEAAEVQRQLEALEAQALVESASRSQRGQALEDMPAAAWRDQLKADFAPMVAQGVNALVKCKALMAEKGPLLERIAGLHIPAGLDPVLHQRYAALLSLASKIREQLGATIRDTQKALDSAASFQPRQYDDAVQPVCHGLQKTLERISAVVIRPKAFRESRAGMIPTRHVPETPPVVAEYAQRIADCLASYRLIQQQVDAATTKPAQEVIITLPKDPAWERRRHAKKASALTPNHDTGRQSHATGVPEGV